MKKFSKLNESESREKLDLTGAPRLLDLLYEEYVEFNNETYLMVSKEQTDFDGEKGYVSYRLIIQRESDGKYFEGYGEDWGRGEREINPHFNEVSKKEKITYYYE